MNYCCHADFTETGDINIVDMNVFIGYQSFASINYNDYDSDIHGSLLDHFTNWYQDQVNDGIYPPTSGVINLPGDPNQDGTDCANYTETDDNIINISDMNIFIGFQSFASINYDDFDPSTDGNMISHFKSWYDDQVSDGIYPALFLDIKHLPSLKEDTQVWTINGLVDKCAPTVTPTPTPEIGPCTAKVNISDSVASITIDLDTITDPGGITNGELSALEIVFDNLEFEEFATVNESGIQEGRPGITTYWDTSNPEIFEFSSITGVTYDYSFRDNGTIPTEKPTVFLLGSVSGVLTLSNFVGQEFLFDVPFTKLTGSRPVISEIRAYDSSTGIKKYNVINCYEEV